MERGPGDGDGGAGHLGRCDPGRAQCRQGQPEVRHHHPRLRCRKSLARLSDRGKVDATNPQDPATQFRIVARGKDAASDVHPELGGGTSAWRIPAGVSSSLEPSGRRPGNQQPHARLDHFDGMLFGVGRRRLWEAMKMSRLRRISSGAVYFLVRPRTRKASGVFSRRRE